MKKIIISAIAISIGLTSNAQLGGLKLSKIKTAVEDKKETKSETKTEKPASNDTKNSTNSSPSATQTNTTKPEPAVKEISISTFHQQNKGKILFLSKKTPYSGLQSATTVNEYTVMKPKESEALEAWYLLDNSFIPVIEKEKNIKELDINKLEFRFNYFIDGQLLQSANNGWKGHYTSLNSESECAFEEQFIKISAGSFSSEAGERIPSQNWESFFFSSIEKLTIGKHQLRVTVNPVYDGKDYDGNKAEGNLSLTVTKKLIDPNDSYICFPTKVNSQALTKDQLAKFFLETEKKQTLSCYVTENDWNLERNALTGTIIRRFIMACFIYKDENKVCHYTRANVCQDYVGGKFNTKLYFSGMPAEGTAPCDCLGGK